MGELITDLRIQIKQFFYKAIIYYIFGGELGLKKSGY